MTTHLKSAKLTSMNLLKSFRVALIGMALALPALAEIRVLPIRVYEVSNETAQNDAQAVTYLLNRGWRVKAVSVANKDATVSLVLESPTQPAALDEITSTDDLFRIRKLTPEEIQKEKAKVKEGK